MGSDGGQSVQLSAWPLYIHPYQFFFLVSRIRYRKRLRYRYPKRKPHRSWALATTLAGRQELATPDGPDHPSDWTEGAGWPTLIYGTIAPGPSPVRAGLSRSRWPTVHVLIFTVPVPKLRRDGAPYRKLRARPCDLLRAPPDGLREFASYRTSPESRASYGLGFERGACTERMGESYRAAAGNRERMFSPSWVSLIEIPQLSQSRLSCQRLPTHSPVISRY
jgi:hypothetical protein